MTPNPFNPRLASIGTKMEQVLNRFRASLLLRLSFPKGICVSTLSTSRKSALNPVFLGHTLLILCVALAMRLLMLRVVLTRYPSGWLFTHGVEMGLLARSILTGQGLSSPFGGNTGPTAIIAPVYPVLVALVFRLFGQFTQASAIVIISAQIVLSLVTIWLIMDIARRLFNQAAATLAGIVFAVSLPLVWMPAILWETSLSCCLLIGLLDLCVRTYQETRHLDRRRAVVSRGAVHRPLHLALIPTALRTMSIHQPVTRLRWILLGAYCGFAALVNPALLPSLLAILAWLALQTRKTTGARPLLAALAFAVVFSPWPIRNARAFHAFVPLRTTVGLELWMGNRDGATGFLDESVFPMYNSQELADYNARGEVAYSAHKSQLSRSYISAHPAWFLRMTAIRAARFWTGTGTRNGSALLAFHACCTTLAGFAGLCLLARSRRYALAMLFALPMALFPLPYIITHAEFRYRLVIDPVMTVFAAFALTELYRLAARSHNPAQDLIQTTSL